MAKRKAAVPPAMVKYIEQNREEATSKLAEDTGLTEVQVEEVLASLPPPPARPTAVTSSGAMSSEMDALSKSLIGVSASARPGVDSCSIEELARRRKPK